MADRLDEAFANTAKILFGRPLQPLDNYSGWLLERIARIERVPSAIGSGTAAIPEYSFFSYIPKSRVVAFEQVQQVENRKISEPADAVSLSGLLKEIKKIAYFIPTFAEGRNIEVKDSTCYIDCLNLKSSFDTFTTKNSAFVFQALRSESIFGCYYNMDTAFSIHCYNCFNVQRSFEMDGAKNCADSMFCHNVENLDNCMFCFNAKTLRYAIGNAELGRKKYMEIKKSVVTEILKKLEAEYRLDFDVYDVLSAKRKSKR